MSRWVVLFAFVAAAGVSALFCRQQHRLYEKKSSEQFQLVIENTKMAAQMTEIDTLLAKAKLARLDVISEGDRFEAERKAIEFEKQADVACGVYGSPAQIDEHMRDNDNRRRVLQDWLDQYSWAKF